MRDGTEKEKMSYATQKQTNTIMTIRIDIPVPPLAGIETLGKKFLVMAA
jgi:hypothetical protein